MGKLKQKIVTDLKKRIELSPVVTDSSKLRVEDANSINKSLREYPPQFKREPSVKEMLYTEEDYNTSSTNGFYQMSEGKQQVDQKWNKEVVPKKWFVGKHIIMDYYKKGKTQSYTFSQGSRKNTAKGECLRS